MDTSALELWSSGGALSQPRLQHVGDLLREAHLISGRQKFEEHLSLDQAHHNMAQETIA